MKTSTAKPKASERFKHAPAIHGPQLPQEFEEIRQLAQAVCAGHGGAAGMALSDWLKAEQELKQSSANTNGISHRKKHL